MKLPWIKPKTATLEELREQYRRAEAAHAQAFAGVEAARAAFDEDGSPAAERALRDAREAADSADQYVERARRLVAAGEEREAAEQRAELEREKAAISTELGDTTKNEALAQREVDAWLAVAAARVERMQHQTHRNALDHRWSQIHVTLGGQADFTRQRDNEPDVIVIVRGLHRAMSGLAPDSPRHRVIGELCRQLAPKGLPSWARQ